MTGASAAAGASPPALLSDAFGHHQAGRLHLAIQGYRWVLAYAPASADALRLIGTAALAGSAYASAKDWLARSLSVDAQSPDSLFNLGNAALALGEKERAGGLYERAGNLRRDWAAAHFAAGDAYHSAGRPVPALRGLRRAIALDAAMLPAIGNVGLLALEAGDHRGAIVWFRRALHLDRLSPEAFSNLGIAFRKSSESAAQASFRKAIALRPAYVDAMRHYLHGSLAGLASSVRIAGLLRVTSLSPVDPAGHLQLTEAAISARRPALARSHARKAASLEPENPLTLLALGNLAMADGQINDAVRRYRLALGSAPTNAVLHLNHGIAAFLIGRHAAARGAFQIALRIDPSSAQAWNGLGVVDEAERGGGADDVVYRRALSIAPLIPDARSNLGTILRGRGALSEATGHCRSGIAASPGHAECMMTLGTLAQDQGRVEEAVRLYRRTLSLKHDYIDAERNLLYAILHQPNTDAQTIFATVRSFAARHLPPRAISSKLTNLPVPDRRLRIGYVSSDFRDHPNRWFMNALFEHRDRGAFDVACYYSWRREDPETAWVRRHVDGFHDVSGIDDAALANLLRADAIDIAVFVGGRFDKNRPLVAAYRAAPVQISYLDGGSSGVRGMDYWLTDDILHPASRMDDDWERFTEELVRLPRLYDFSNAMPDAAVSPLPAKTAGHVTFGSFAQPARINLDVIATWARVLRQTPLSRLTLKSRNRYDDITSRRRILDALALHGVEPERIRFLSGIDKRAQHLDRYGSIDIALDTFPFSGATTNFEALWMGLPVVSLSGRSFVSRMATSILVTAGLPDLVADTHDGYVERAVSLATDLPALARLRADLRPLLQASPLRDGPAYARSIELAYRTLWQRWCAQEAGAT